MKKVILRFRTPRELWEFKMITKAASVEINLRDCTLICDCNDAETDLAIKAFKAQIQREGELLKIQ